MKADTKGIIGREQLSLMKKSAILINTARGGVLDSVTLAETPTKGNIAGAACDVFETEPPLPADHPLLRCPNTIICASTSGRWPSATASSSSTSLTMAPATSPASVKTASIGIRRSLPPTVRTCGNSDIPTNPPPETMQ